MRPLITDTTIPHRKLRYSAVWLGIVFVLPFFFCAIGFAQSDLDGSPLLAQMVQSASESNAETVTDRSNEERRFSLNSIGIIRSPYTPNQRPPRQGRLAPDVPATIEIYEKYEAGLEGIEDFDTIYVLFVFDRSQGWTAKVTPPGAAKARGVFSTRSPNRPCPIGLTVVRLEKREGRFLYIKGIDAFDQTPVLDIKPYIGSIDAFPDAGRKVEKDLGLK